MSIYVCITAVANAALKTVLGHDQRNHKAEISVCSDNIDILHNQ